MTIPQHIKFHRELLRLTQKQLAEAMGKPRLQAQICHYEHGNFKPSKKNVDLLDKTFLKLMTEGVIGLSKGMEHYQPLSSLT